MLGDWSGLLRSWAAPVSVKFAVRVCPEDGHRRKEKYTVYRRRRPPSGGQSAMALFN